MGLDPFNFSDALLAVLAQRLVKRICTECKEEYHPDEDEFAELEHAFGGKEETAKFGIDYNDDFVLFRGKGCGNCNNSGYRGRAGIHELLVANDGMKRLIANGAVLRAFPQDVMDASYKAANEVYAEHAKTNVHFKKLLDSLTPFRSDSYQWLQVAELAYDSFMMRMRTRA